MVSLIRKLWTDQVGSSVSSEMAMVTSVTIGALFMGMSQFSATVNREFQQAAENTGLTISELEEKEEQRDEEAEKEAKKDDEENDEKKSTGWRFRRAEDRDE